MAYTSAALPRPSTPSAAGFASFLRRANAAVHVANQRRQLAALDDHMLADLGLTREEATYEASRPFWDAPTSWLR